MLHNCRKELLFRQLKVLTLDNSAKNKLADRLVRSGREKKSKEDISNSASPILRSRIDHLVRVTPELVVRKRGRTVVEESEEEETNQKAAKQQKMDSLQLQMTKMLEGMGDLKKSVATKDNIRGVNNRLKSIEAEQKSFDARLTKIERERERANMSRPMTGPRPRPLNADRSTEEAAQYRKARHSVYISPADPDMAGVEKYLCQELGMSSEVVGDLQKEEIRPIHSKKMPAHRKETTETKKVQISLRDSYE